MNFQNFLEKKTEHLKIRTQCSTNKEHFNLKSSKRKHIGTGAVNPKTKHFFKNLVNKSEDAVSLHLDLYSYVFLHIILEM